MKLLHQPEEIIAQRYRIINTLGQGGIGITYQALDLKTNQEVALKVLSLRQMNEWKKIELFEREAQILSQLNHPGIPQYLDYFQVDTATDRYFYIAQQLAPGKSLAELVENGWRSKESEVKEIVIKILNILVYLQSLTPPVIHRDIKPQNIILTPDKQIFLVDFGAVQDTYHNTISGGSTIVGTFGYMAPEQCRGQAVLSTDLYGLGTTILFLLTGKSPEKLPSRNLKLNFRSHVRVSPKFANWLEKMLEPAIEDRFISASVALATLQGEQTIAKNFRGNFYQPKNSKINLRETEKNLIIEIMSPNFRNNFQEEIFVFFLLIWNFLLSYPLLWLISISWISSLFVFLNNLTNYDRVIINFPNIILMVVCIITLNYRVQTIINLGRRILFGINFNVNVIAPKINDNLMVFIINWLILFLCINYNSYKINNKDIMLWLTLLDISFVLWWQRSFMISLKTKICLEISSDKFMIQSNWINQQEPKFEYSTNSTELIKPILTFLSLPMGENPITDIFLKESLSSQGFCKLRSCLNQAEKEWLAAEIKNYLKDKNINT